jgi:predicted outer membrane protein
MAKRGHHKKTQSKSCDEYRDDRLPWAVPINEIDLRKQRFMVAAAEFQQRKELFLRKKVHVDTNQWCSPHDDDDEEEDLLLPHRQQNHFSQVHNEEPSSRANWRHFSSRTDQVPLPTPSHEPPFRARQHSHDVDDDHDFDHAQLKRSDYQQRRFVPHPGSSTESSLEDTSHSIMTTSLYESEESEFSGEQDEATTSKRFAENPIKNHRTMKHRAKNLLTRSGQTVAKHQQARQAEAQRLFDQFPRQHRQQQQQQHSNPVRQQISKQQFRREFAPISPTHLDKSLSAGFNNTSILATHAAPSQVPVTVPVPKKQTNPLSTSRSHSQKQVTSVREYRSSDRPVNYRQEREPSPPTPTPTPTPTPLPTPLAAQASAPVVTKTHATGKQGTRSKVEPEANQNRTSAKVQTSTKQHEHRQRTSSKNIQPRYPPLELTGIIDKKIKVAMIRSQSLFYHPQVHDRQGKLLGGSAWAAWREAGFTTIGDVFEGDNKLRYGEIFAAFPPSSEHEAVKQLDIICASIPNEWREELWKGSKH